MLCHDASHRRSVFLKSVILDLIKLNLVSPYSQCVLDCRNLHSSLYFSMVLITWSSGSGLVLLIRYFFFHNLIEPLAHLSSSHCKLLEFVTSTLHAIRHQFSHLGLFWFDFLTSIPVSFLDLAILQVSFTSFLKFFRFAKLFFYHRLFICRLAVWTAVQRMFQSSLIAARYDISRCSIFPCFITTTTFIYI